MKKYKQMVWGILVFQLLVFLIIVATAKVDDMKLSKGETFSFNEGWTIIREDGTVEKEVTLPYFGECAPNEKIIMENKIPTKFCGKTLSFLAADKVIDIMVEGRDIYTFGMKDKKLIGKTPGSVMVYADIPEYSAGKILQIVTYSPYPDYASYATSISVGDRDVLILKHIESNSFDLLCALIIITIGITVLVLSAFLKMTQNSDFGSIYMAICLLLFGVYHLGETKLLTIFMGNQFLYSNLVFVVIMTVPMFFLMHLGMSVPETSKITRWLMYLPVINITVQVILQITNLVDYLNMAFVSHVIIAIVSVVAIVLLYNLIRRKPNKKLVILFVGVVSMTLGGGIDVYRNYIYKVGDFGKFSRYGTTVYAICGMIVLLYNMIDAQISFVEKSRDEAEQANKAKSMFLANMSHEIRTPINAVLGLDTMILRESNEHTIKEYANDIKNAGESLLSIINDILDFSKIEAGKMEIVPGEYDFASLIHDVMNMIEPKANDKGLKLELNLDEELPSFLYGDDVRIRQILINLLNNAVKYTEKGFVHLNISGSVVEDVASIKFSVQDSGIGIKEEDIGKLFVQFQRVDEEKNRNIEGTGLGMSISNQLLALMDSKLEIESEYGKGSNFYFVIKQRVVNEEPIGNLAERINNRTDNYEYTVSFEAPAAKVLVVDDNAMNRNVFRALLKKTNMQIYEAPGGQQCIDICWQERFDIVFLDHMMPEMDGVETLHKMRNIPNYPNRNTPIIVLTANAISGAREQYLEEGFDDFLAKPINPDRLEKMVIDYLPQDYLMTAEEAKSWMEEHKFEMHVEEELPATETDIPLPQIQGVDWNKAMESLKEKSIVISVAKDFGKLVDSHKQVLLEKYQALKTENDMEDNLRLYRVQVHSMKSSAAMIGAMETTEMAKELEFAARDGKLNVINEKTERFLAEWDRIGAAVKKAFMDETGRVADVDYNQVRDYLEQLEQAIDDMDLDAMDKVADGLKEYKFSDEEQKLVDDIIQAVFNVDYDRCLELAEKLRGTIA